MANRWDALAALVDSSRRALYEYVRRADHPVSREEAAEATGISRGLAAFHLDKLVETGWLLARYQAPPDQPRGRGRAPKVYEPAGDGVAVSIPERRYELIAEILADAVAEDPTHAEEAARRCAYQRGRELGGGLRASGADLHAALTALGFDPHPVTASTATAVAGPAAAVAAPAARSGGSGSVLLGNCPFHALAVRHTALVCGINHAFLTGLVDGLGADVRALLAPRPRACCVELAAGHGAHPTETGGSDSRARV